MSLEYHRIGTRRRFHLVKIDLESFYFQEEASTAPKFSCSGVRGIIVESLPSIPLNL